MTSRDETFRAFSAEEAVRYASGRGASYPPTLYNVILDYHTGRRELLLDVGTGPGKVAFDLLPLFTHIIGCDTSVQMIEQANMDAAREGKITEGKTRFLVAGGEECATALKEEEVGTVDIITVAMTAHWLNLSDFYASAAKALRPGGTLAIWTCSSYYCHPSVPNHGHIQAIFTDFEDNKLGPYTTPGNAMSRNAYKNLPLPWSAGELTSTLFDQEAFVRRDWDCDGVPSSPPLADGTPGPYLIAAEEATVESLGAALSSASMVIRWRQAHAEKANGDEDVVHVAMKQLSEALGGRQSFAASPSCSLLLFRRTNDKK